MTEVITLKKLHTEGRLSIGDTLHSNVHGDCELVAVNSRGDVRVKNLSGQYLWWAIDFGPDAKLVEVVR